MIRIIAAFPLLALAACANNARYRPAPCAFELPRNARVECGWLRVPENRAKPVRRTLELHIARYRSTSPRPRPDPIVWLVGGPGGKGHALSAALFDKIVRPYLDERDFIVLDPRGVGYSRPAFSCGEPTRACLDRLRREGFQLESYNSIEFAADLEDLRLALGIKQWNVLGESYGTHLALVAMRLYPTGIRSVILDSALPPGFDNRAIGEQSYRQSLALLFANCKADPACAKRYPDLPHALDEARASLAKRPVRLAGLRHHTAYDIPLHAKSIDMLLFVAFMETDLIGLMPAAITGLAQGEAREGWHRAASTHAVIRQHLVNDALNAVWSCNDSATLPGYRAKCEELGLVQQLSWPRDPSPIPTLLLSGEYDASTPPEAARSALPGLPNGKLVVLKGYGHMVTASGDCSVRLIKRFLANPGGRVTDRCVDTLQTRWVLEP
ncbi:MAG: alpha/beta fold hydrolase [Bryobacteraceae bacterium]|nr:alpha/beta fold hydrolase [Bryobacteraceae bacterium]